MIQHLARHKVLLPILLLALIAVLAILLAGLPGLLYGRELSAWPTPVLPSASPTVSPTPGWWGELPTPAPLFILPTPTNPTP